MTGINTFSRFTLAASTAPLPVELVSFAAATTNSKVELQWKTATENNSAYFTIERSNDGQDFKSIGTVNASGFSNSEITYYFTDASPLAGVNYYRLIMVDKDNSREYSKVVSISSKKSQSLNILNVQLSAGKSSLELIVSTTQSQKANLVLFDSNGRIIFTETAILQKGINTIHKNTPALSRAVYYVKLITEDESSLVKSVFSGD